jgi:glycosyltransferase involved in cell wall biosynthesis
MSKNSIEIHLLVKQNQPAWYQNNLATLLEALDKEPVSVRICDHLEGDIRAARIAAYKAAQTDYVGYCDPDDMVISGVYQKLLDAIQPEHCGAFCKQYLGSINSRGLTPFEYPDKWSLEWHAKGTTHTVMPAFIARREAYLAACEHTDVIPAIWGQDRAIAMLASAYGDWKLVDTYGYVWRRTGENISQIMQDKHSIEEFHKRIWPAYGRALELRHQHLTQYDEE